MLTKRNKRSLLLRNNMTTLQQQKDAIDEEARLTKIEADKTAFAERQVAADLESERIRLVAEQEIKQIQYDAQK